MKVLVLSTDDGGCAYYRVYEPVRASRLLGVDVTAATDVEVLAEYFPGTGLTSVSEVQTDADVIVIQRPMDNAFTSLIQQAKRQGIATIVELDDDFESVHPNNVAADTLHAFKGHGPQWIRAAAEAADHVIVSTPALTKYAPHGRVSVLRNCVPESIFDVKPAYERERDGISVGWTGTIQTHPTDLQQTKGALRDVTKDGVFVVGDGRQVLTALRLPESSPFYATGWMDGMDAYYEAITGMDVGMVPLDIIPFNQAKSALKGLEMAALGVPFVASPTREYERLAAYGVGTVAKGPSDWARKLNRLTQRESERVKIAKQYQEIIYNEMTYEKNAEGWVSAWETALRHRRSQP